MKIRMLDQIREAQKRLEPYIFKTPVIRLEGLDEILGCQVYVKADCMQKTNSFKIRGALNKMLQLPQEKLKHGVIAVSSGNHGKGVAYAAKMLGVPCTIVLTDTAPEIKQKGIRELGAEAILCPLEDRQKLAAKLSEEKQYTIIPPYDDKDIIAGQGTAGLEIMEQLPDVDAVVVPVSGGGLISGISSAVKLTKPEAKVYGAEPAVVGRYFKSYQAGKRITVPKAKSIADALLVLTPGEINYEIVAKYVDELFQVEETFIRKGARTLVEMGKVMCEPSSGIGIGAALQGCLHVKRSDKVCFFISGGNAELEQLVNL